MNTLARPPKIVTSNLSLFYGQKQALKNIYLDIHEREVTALLHRCAFTAFGNLSFNIR
jgi:ABC-type phosphate transport system ATPase subunit